MLKIFENENFKLTQKIKLAIEKNSGYCPCKLEKIEENKCPCSEFVKSKSPGFCHCTLFYKKEVQNK